MSENRSIPRRADPRSTSPRQWPVDDLEIALSSTFPDRRWLPVLEAAAHTSVADTAQIQADTGLSRDQVNAVLNHFDTLTGGNILTRIALSVPRPGVRGRASNLYALGDLGAALLRAHGHPNAHPCGFADDARQLSHARAMIDVRLAAQAAGLDVVTDRLLPYEDDRVLRPDNLVTLPNGTRAMFEIEQEANLSVLRRVTDSVRNKAAFYRSADVGSTSRTIRVLINLTLGSAWDKMLQVWERATAIVADECGGDLPFQLLAMPLHVFLDQPDWGESPEVARWTSLFDPAQTVAFGPDEPPANQVAQRPGKRSRCSTQDRSVPQLPAKVVRRTPVDDQLILRAYYQHLCETGPELAYTADVARPHPAFFQTMQVVYAASHPENPTPMQEAAYPYASLYLLQRYFDLHPRLRQALSLTLDRGRYSVRWNSGTIMHRMQVAIDVFLRYHGWQSCTSLLVYPTSGWDRPNDRQDFGVSVRIKPELLLGDDDGVLPSRREAEEAAEALAWVLWAILAHSEYLRIKPAPFW